MVLDQSFLLSSYLVLSLSSAETANGSPLSFYSLYTRYSYMLAYTLASRGTLVTSAVADPGFKTGSRTSDPGSKRSWIPIRIKEF